jgi:hypothetical protein
MVRNLAVPPYGLHIKEVPKKKHSVGCLIPLGLYVAVLVVGFFVTRPPVITEDFSGQVARSFSVAIVVEETDDGSLYERRTLEIILEQDTGLRPYRYLLPERNITIDNGDIHHATVIEDNGESQLIEFNYSNTYMATSIYRAYEDRIEPVSYQITSSVGDVMMATAVTVVAVLLYLIAVLVNFIRNRRSKHTGA